MSREKQSLWRGMELKPGGACRANRFKNVALMSVGVDYLGGPPWREVVVPGAACRVHEV